jgi:PD-(D/E)XK endonuclease
MLQAPSVEMEHPKDIGDRSMLTIIFAFRLQGWQVLVPFGENTRYDLVVDRGGQLERVQCKTGRLRDGAVTFRCCSSYAHHPNPKVIRRDYLGQIDEFAVFCPETQAVYSIPIEDLPVRNKARLRVEPPRNNQFNGVRFARAYEIAKIDVY